MGKQEIPRWADVSRGVGRPEVPHRRTFQRQDDERLVGVSAMAEALGRSVVTVRRMEHIGTLPAAPLRSRSHDPRGRRRLYPAKLVDEVARAAHEERLGRRMNMSATNFPAAVAEIYARHHVAQHTRQPT